jgi:hypothetical protein
MSYSTKITFTMEEEAVRLNLHEAMLDDGSGTKHYSMPSKVFVIPNEQIAALLKHVLGLASKPKAASKLKVKAHTPANHFEAFWSLYPATRRVARAQMQVKWAANHLDTEWPAIERHLQVSMPGWAKDQYRYCPLATTYLNQRRWEAIADEVQPVIV